MVSTVEQIWEALPTPVGKEMDRKRGSAMELRERYMIMLAVMIGPKEAKEPLESSVFLYKAHPLRVMEWVI